METKKKLQKFPFEITKKIKSEKTAKICNKYYFIAFKQLNVLKYKNICI